MQNGRPVACALTAVSGILSVQAVRRPRSSVLTAAQALLSWVCSRLLQLPGNGWLWVPNLAGMRSCWQVQFRSTREEGLCRCQQEFVSSGLLVNRGDFCRKCSIGDFRQAPPGFPAAHRPQGPVLRDATWDSKAKLAVAAATARSPWTALD